MACDVPRNNARSRLSEEWILAMSALADGSAATACLVSGGLVDPAAMTALDVSTKQPPTFTIRGPPRQPDRRRDPTVV